MNQPRTRIDPASLELPPTQPIDITAFLLDLAEDSATVPGTPSAGG